MRAARRLTGRPLRLAPELICDTSRYLAILRRTLGHNPNKLFFLRVKGAILWRSLSWATLEGETLGPTSAYHEDLPFLLAFRSSSQARNERPLTLHRLAMLCVFGACVSGCGSKGDDAGSVRVSADGSPYVQGEYLHCECGFTIPADGMQPAGYARLQADYVCYDPDARSMADVASELSKRAGDETTCTCQPGIDCGGCPVPLVTADTGVTIKRNADGSWPLDPSTLVQEIRFLMSSESATLPDACDHAR